MLSDFSGAREHLEKALSLLAGRDPETLRLRKVLGLTIEAFIQAGHLQHALGDNVIRLPFGRRCNRSAG